MVRPLLSLFLLCAQVYSASVILNKQSLDNQEINLTEVNSALTEEDFKAAAYIYRLYQGNSSCQNLTLDDIRVKSPAHGEARPITANLFRRWDFGEIPYEISILYGPIERAWIADAFATYHKHTNIRFVKRELYHYNFLHIFPGNGCWSYVGRQFGLQLLSLAPGCFYGSAVLHELMHAAGFNHEQNRSDRDEHVSIRWENIEFGYANNFNKVNPFLFSNIAGQYDYESIMHYTEYAFSRNNHRTIVPLKEGIQNIGMADTFSKGDIKKLNAMYPS